MKFATRFGAAFSVLALFLAAPLSPAAQLPGMGMLSGRVTTPKPLGQLTVYALNTDKRVGYMVYVVDGQYRATNLFPGRYEVTLRGTAGQLNWSLPQQTRKLRVAAGRLATADFTVGDVTPEPTYIGGRTYPDARVEPYDVVFPPGPGRDSLERVCFGCHTIQLYPYTLPRAYPSGRPAHDREGWALTVDRMAKGLAFGAPGKTSYFDPTLLSPKDREELIDYLARNFGPDSPPRVARQDSEPALDPAALAKAQIVEFRFPNEPDADPRRTHTPDFDGQGNVWVMDTGGQSLVKVDPVKGTVTDHKGHGGGEFLTVDRDGTIWYGGLSHYDPKTNKHDDYRFNRGGSPGYMMVSTHAIDSSGNIWLSMLTTGGLGKFDRSTNSVIWWDVPFARSRPYGITIDRDDNVWIAEYHNNGLARFDTKTQSFRHFTLTVQAQTSIRRPGVDSKGFVWAGTYGSRGMRNGALYRLDPRTGEVEEHRLRIPFANPYDAEIDAADNVWVATDNHVVRFDQATGNFTHYPVTTRTDIPKLAVTRDGTVWFAPRNAGESGDYGGALSALFPDKDAITSFAAYYTAEHPRNRKASHDWPAIPVQGKTIMVLPAPQNPCEFANAVGLGATCKADAAGAAGSSGAIKGGAARE